jgi:hypothetical protein
MMETKWSNQRKQSRNHYPSVGGVLERNDKARICILARQAYDKAETTQNFETWRHHEQFIAVTGANPLLDRTSRLSLLDCNQRDVPKLIAHFQDLAGEPGHAVKTYLRESMKDQAVALHKLKEACEERGLELSYPGKICKQQYKCAIEDASPNQIWRLVFTIRNRKKKTEDMECPF